MICDLQPLCKGGTQSWSRSALRAGCSDVRFPHKGGETEGGDVGGRAEVCACLRLFPVALVTGSSPLERDR